MPGSPRLFSLCRELSGKRELHLVARCLSDERRRWFVDDDAIRGSFASFTTLPNPPASAAWWNRQRHRVLRGAHFESRYLYPGYHQEIFGRVRSLAASRRVEVVYVDSLAMAQYVEGDRTLPALIDIRDSLTRLTTRMMRAAGQRKKRLLLYLQSSEVAKREEALAKRFALVVANSPVDETAIPIRRLCPSTRTMVIENGVDTEFFKPDGTSADPRRLIFTGVLGYPPNEDAAVYFCRAILPLIRRQCPDTEFWAVGSEPTRRVQRLAEIPGVHVDGPYVRPYLRSAGLFVCPLRSGAGNEQDTRRTGHGETAGRDAAERGGAGFPGGPRSARCRRSAGVRRRGRPAPEGSSRPGDFRPEWTRSSEAAILVAAECRRARPGVQQCDSVGSVRAATRVSADRVKTRVSSTGAKWAALISAVNAAGMVCGQPGALAWHGFAPAASGGAGAGRTDGTGAALVVGGTSLQRGRRN